MYSSTIKMIKDNPLFGVGIENWRINYPQYAGSIINDDNFQIIRQRPHNDLLWITAEIGIIGLFFVFSFFIFHLKPAVRPIMNIKNKDPTDIQLINTFIILSILAIVIESMFDFPKQRVMPNLYVWSGLGFLGNQIIQNNKKNLKVGKIFQYGIVFIMIFISFAMYKDYRSNTYSQDAKYYNNNSMPNELYSSSEIALNYYRNMDVEGTPLYYYMGIAKYKLGDLNSASSLFKKALNIAPYHIGALMNYLIVLGQLDELESAYNIMLVIQDVYPNMAKPRLDMAKFLINASLQDQAGKILMEMKDNNIDDKSRTRDKLLSLIK
jgi:tetratricopeptide (TPR) repeat protein